MHCNYKLFYVTILCLQMSFMFGTVKKLVSKKEQTFRESIDKNKYVVGYARDSGTGVLLWILRNF